MTVVTTLCSLCPIKSKIVDVYERLGTIGMRFLSNASVCCHFQSDRFHSQIFLRCFHQADFYRLEVRLPQAGLQTKQTKNVRKLKT